MTEIQVEALLQAHKMAAALRTYASSMMADRQEGLEHSGTVDVPTDLELMLHNAAELLAALANEIKLLRDRRDLAVRSLIGTG